MALPQDHRGAAARRPRRPCGQARASVLARFLGPHRPLASAGSDGCTPAPTRQARAPARTPPAPSHAPTHPPTDTARPGGPPPPPPRQPRPPARTPPAPPDAPTPPPTDPARREPLDPRT